MITKNIESLNTFIKKINSENTANLDFDKVFNLCQNSITSFRSTVNDFFKSQLDIANIEIFPFDIFPKGVMSISKFIGMLRSGETGISIENEIRLHKIAETFPEYQAICRGKGDFKGFVVFRFRNTNAVIVEKPFYGNATYLIKGDWEKEVIKILQMSRGEARQLYPKQVKRIYHTDEKNWLSNLEFEFKHWF